MKEVILENEYMKIVKTERGEKTFGKQVLKEREILAVMADGITVRDLIDKIRIEGEFLPLVKMWNWLIEREEEGKVVRRVATERHMTLWKRDDFQPLPLAGNRSPVVNKRIVLADLIRDSEQIFAFVQSAIENQIDGNMDWYRKDKTVAYEEATAKNCGLTVVQLQMLEMLI